jgi:dihydrolipoamide dehydrogenase
MTQEEAKENHDIKVGRFPLQSSGKAQVIDQGQGRVKIIADREHGEILGVHMIGAKATELIAEAVLGMSMGMTIHDLAEAVHPHPTLSESLREAALSLTGGAIHAL